MVRKQVYIEERHDEILKRLARERNVTEAELIREGIDGLGTARRPLPPDPAAWEEALAFLRRLKAPARSGRRG